MSSFAELAIQIDRLMRMINADLQPRTQQFDYEKVGPIGGMLLLAIGEAEPITLQDVIMKMGRDKSQITRLVQSLERKKLIKKEKSNLDGRELILCLTSNGRHQLESIQSELAKIVERIFEPLSERETSLFSEILEQLVGPVA